MKEQQIAVLSYNKVKQKHMPHLQPIVEANPGSYYNDTVSDNLFVHATDSSNIRTESYDYEAVKDNSWPLDVNGVDAIAFDGLTNKLRFSFGESDTPNGIIEVSPATGSLIFKNLQMLYSDETGHYAHFENPRLIIASSTIGKAVNNQAFTHSLLTADSYAFITDNVIWDGWKKHGDCATYLDPTIQYFMLNNRFREENLNVNDQGFLKFGSNTVPSGTIRIVGNTFTDMHEYFNAGGNTSVIGINLCDNNSTGGSITIQDNTISLATPTNTGLTRYGIRVSENDDATVIIDGNTISGFGQAPQVAVLIDLATEATNPIIRNNTFSNNYRSILFNPTAFTLNDVKIYNNNFTLNGSSTSAVLTSGTGGGITDIDLYGNTVTSNGVTGSTETFFLDDVEGTINIYSNTFHDVTSEVQLRDSNNNIANIYNNIFDTIPSLGLSFVGWTNGTTTVANNIFYNNTDAIYGHSIGDENISLLNNIFLSNTDAVEEATAAGSFVIDYNIWSGNTNDINNSNASTPSAKGSNDRTGNPLFIDAPNRNFRLKPLSPAIDIGTTTLISMQSKVDQLSNNRYGSVDAGPIEYQPPYTIETNDIDITGYVRLYSDGKYRYTTATSSGTLADLTITPVNGFPSGNYSEYLNFKISQWLTSGTYAKTWSATSSIATTTTITANDLAASTYYVAKADGTFISAPQKNSTSDLTFNYSSGYSPTTAVQFTITQDTTAPAVTLTAPINATTVSNTTPTLSWSGADTETGVTFYGLYINNSLYSTTTQSSIVPTTLSCENRYTWKVEVNDNAENQATSSEKVFTTGPCPLVGGGGIVGLFGSVNQNFPTPAPQNSDQKTGIFTPEEGVNTGNKGTYLIELTGPFVFGVRSEQTKLLQEILAKDPEIYPEGLITGYYGGLTKAAVEKFQRKYGVIPFGSSDENALGYAGPKTREKIKEVFSTPSSTTQPIVASPETVPSSQIIFAKNLYMGITSEDVHRLQQFLNMDPDTKITGEGAGSPGKETNYFGFLTEQAVKRFQKKYNIVSSGDPNTTGYGFFGPKTRAMLEEVKRKLFENIPQNDSM